MQLSEAYRPGRWEDVIGQDEVIWQVNALRKRGLGGRAYAITGKSGTGKNCIARLLALEVAGPMGIAVMNARKVTMPYIDRMESEMHNRILPSDESGKMGRAWIFDEIHLFRDEIVTRLLSTLEPDNGALPDHVMIIFTTTAAAKKSLFAEFEDAQPFLQRCKRLELSQRGLAQSFANRLQEICRAEGLGNPTLEQCVQLVNSESASMRGALDRIEDGIFLETGTLLAIA